MVEHKDSNAELTEIPISEIQNKIQKGDPVKYDYAKIMGDLKVYELSLPIEHVDRTEFQRFIQGWPEKSKVVSSSIEITNSSFDGEVDFSNVLFKDSINFRDTVFSKFAHFGGARFSRYTYFGRVTFIDNTYFDGAAFNQDTYFNGTTFNKDANFKGAIFSQNVNFSESEFKGGAIFIAATFSQFAEFTRTRFNGVLAYFGEAQQNKFEKNIELIFYIRNPPEKLTEQNAKNIKREVYNYFDKFKFEGLDIRIVDIIFGEGSLEINVILLVCIIYKFIKDYPEFRSGLIKLARDIRKIIGKVLEINHPPKEIEIHFIGLLDKRSKQLESCNVPAQRWPKT